MIRPLVAMNQQFVTDGSDLAATVTDMIVKFPEDWSRWSPDDLPGNVRQALEALELSSDAQAGSMAMPEEKVNF